MRVVRPFKLRNLFTMARLDGRRVYRCITRDYKFATDDLSKLVRLVRLADKQLVRYAERGHGIFEKLLVVLVQ